MKIGIITFHFPLNYGATLQAYALQHCLEHMGHQAEIIDYQPAYHTQKYNWRWSHFGINDSNLRYLALNRGFKRFCKRYLKTSRLYTSYEDLQRDPPEADAYICGSDQIWCPHISNGDPAYFLDFAPEGTKRIAYAPSFGVAQISEKDMQNMAGYLKKFDRISSRELSGKKLVGEMTGLDVDCVVDPTFLIEDYHSITTAPKIKKDYILEVILQPSQLLESTARSLAAKTGLPIIRVYGFAFKRWKYQGRNLYPGPDGYVGLMQNAKYVVTNSFHATVFSLIFKRPFFVVALSGSVTSKSTRMTELLQPVRIPDRFLEKLDEENFQKLIDRSIDWDAVHEQIHRQREVSVAFLKESLLS